MGIFRFTLMRQRPPQALYRRDLRPGNPKQSEKSQQVADQQHGEMIIVLKCLYSGGRLDRYGGGQSVCW